MKYILKKDLPSVKAGTEFKESSPLINADSIMKRYWNTNLGISRVYTFTQKEIDEMPDWFSPCNIISVETIEDKKWTDGDMEMCWYEARREKKNVLGRGTMIDKPISFSRLMDEVLKWDNFTDYFRELEFKPKEQAKTLPPKPIIDERLGYVKPNESNSTIAPKEKEIVKPPLGLIPMWMHHERRLDEIKAAIKRYEDAKKDVPTEWIAERDTLYVMCHERKHQNGLTRIEDINKLNDYFNTKD